jgi:hypothetical protein
VIIEPPQRHGPRRPCDPRDSRAVHVRPPLAALHVLRVESHESSPARLPRLPHVSGSRHRRSSAPRTPLPLWSRWPGERDEVRASRMPLADAAYLWHKGLLVRMPRVEVGAPCTQTAAPAPLPHPAPTAFGRSRVTPAPPVCISRWLIEVRQPTSHVGLRTRAWAPHRVRLRTLTMLRTVPGPRTPTRAAHSDSGFALRLGLRALSPVFTLRLRPPRPGPRIGTPARALHLDSRFAP